ncbi:hypothetical protein ACX9MO_12330 [Pseudooceanicola sp. 502str34]
MLEETENHDLPDDVRISAAALKDNSLGAYPRALFESSAEYTVAAADPIESLEREADEWALSMGRLLTAVEASSIPSVNGSLDALMDWIKTNHPKGPATKGKGEP